MAKVQVAPFLNANEIACEREEPNLLFRKDRMAVLKSGKLDAEDGKEELCSHSAAAF